MRINVLLFARIAQIIFALVVLGLTSYGTYSRFPSNAH